MFNATLRYAIFHLFHYFGFMIFHTFHFVCRWSFTPLDDAIKFGHKEIQKILESYIEEETEHTLQDNIKKEES